MAPVAEAVSPRPEPEVFHFCEAAQAPAGTHQGPHMTVDDRRTNVLRAGDAVVQSGSRLARALGAVQAE